MRSIGERARHVLYNWIPGREWSYCLDRTGTINIFPVTKPFPAQVPLTWEELRALTNRSLVEWRGVTKLSTWQTGKDTLPWGSSELVFRRTVKSAKRWAKAQDWEHRVPEWPWPCSQYLHELWTADNPYDKWIEWMRQLANQSNVVIPPTSGAVGRYALSERCRRVDTGAPIAPSYLRLTQAILQVKPMFWGYVYIDKQEACAQAQKLWKPMLDFLQNPSVRIHGSLNVNLTEHLLLRAGTQEQATVDYLGRNVKLTWSRREVTAQEISQEEADAELKRLHEEWSSEILTLLPGKV